MRTSYVQFEKDEIRIIVEVDHCFSCTEEEIIYLAKELLQYMHNIGVMFFKASILEEEKVNG